MNTLALLTLLGLGAEPPDPALALALAVAQTQTCPVEAPQKVGLKKGEAEKAKRLSIPLLFRPDRFRLEEGGTALLFGREVSIINFFPLPKERQPKALSGENKDYHKAMNFLTGSVYLDRETGGIVRIEARLAQEVGYRLNLAKLQKLNLLMDQKLQGAKWLPFYISFEASGRGAGPLGILGRYERYEAHFACAN